MCVQVTSDEVCFQATTAPGKQHNSNMTVNSENNTLVPGDQQGGGDSARIKYTTSICQSNVFFNFTWKLPTNTGGLFRDGG